MAFNRGMFASAPTATQLPKMPSVPQVPNSSMIRQPMPTMNTVRPTFSLPTMRK